MYIGSNDVFVGDEPNGPFYDRIIEKILVGETNPSTVEVWYICWVLKLVLCNDCMLGIFYRDSIENFS